jgi:GNAT superfamily N-acetyltransferase
MPEIVIEPATSERFADAEHALTGGGDGRSCQCQWWTLTNAQWQSTDTSQREQLLRGELAEAPPPALIAYVDGDAAGWVRVGPRERQVRLARTKHFAAHSVHAWGDPTVWAVSCFVVRREHRGTGLMSRLLDAAVAFAAENGARVIEAYPFDPSSSSRRRSSNELFHGVLSTFEGAGFREVARPRPDLVIVSLDVQ